ILPRLAATPSWRTVLLFSARDFSRVFQTDVMHPLERFVGLVFHVRPRKYAERLLSFRRAARLNVYGQVLVFEPSGRLLRMLFVAESPNQNENLRPGTCLPWLRRMVSPFDARKNLRCRLFRGRLRGMRRLSRFVRRRTCVRC